MYRPGVHGWTKVRRLNSTAALIGAVTGSLRRPEVLPLGRYDTTGCLRLAGKTASLKSRSARDLAAAGPGHSPNGPIMLIWDDLKVHKDAGLEEFTETRDWLTIYYLPALRARPQPRRGHLVTPTARMALQRRLQQPGTPRPGKRPWARAATPGMPRGLGSQTVHSSCFQPCAQPGSTGGYRQHLLEHAATLGIDLRIVRRDPTTRVLTVLPRLTTSCTIRTVAPSMQVNGPSVATVQAPDLR